jgi:hypothetical protein
VQLSAAGFAPANPLESAILATLDPGAYTAILSGVGGATGIGILGVYEVVQTPQVVTTFPLDAAQNISVTAVPTVLFSEPMDPATLNASTFTLTGPTGPVAATVSASGTSATLTPTTPLTTNASYTATVTTGARDLAGIALAQNYAFHFSMRADEPPPVVAGCPTPDASAQLRRLEWGAISLLKRNSGEVTSFRVAQSPLGRASVAFTQGQTASSPPSPTIDMTVSRCPGVIETNLHPACYYTTTHPDFAGIVAFNRAVPLYGWNTQEQLAAYGCLAPNTEQYYVNIRWTYPKCPPNVGVCGYSLQWGEGSY